MTTRRQRRVSELIHRELSLLLMREVRDPRLSDVTVTAVEITPDERIVRVRAHRAAEITGQAPTMLGCGPWNDGWMFITRGIPAVCGFGPNGAGVHGPDEYVTLDSLIATARIYARAVIDF